MLDSCADKQATDDCYQAGQEHIVPLARNHMRHTCVLVLGPVGFACQALLTKCNHSKTCATALRKAMKDIDGMTKVGTPDIAVGLCHHA